MPRISGVPLVTTTWASVIVAGLQILVFLIIVGDSIALLHTAPIVFGAMWMTDGFRLLRAYGLTTPAVRAGRVAYTSFLLATIFFSLAMGVAASRQAPNASMEYWVLTEWALVCVQAAVLLLATRLLQEAPQ